MKIQQRTVTDFFDTEYLNYAKYTVENRAIPSCIDGLKPGQRKVIYVANNIWKTGNEKPLKLFQLSGRVASESFYHHGSSSLEVTMTGMAQSFKNSMPLLDGVGQFGSLRSPEAGAPRYISARLHPNFRLLYKDFELLENKLEEGEKIEPEYFLPIIPTVILNGSSGIAIGFATNILNRNPTDVIDACLAVLNGKKIKSLAPWINGFSGSFERDLTNPNTWIIKGSYKIVNTTTVKITEIPPGFTYEKYEEHLNNLADKKIITSYDDNSSEKIEYIVKFNRAHLSKLLSTDRLDNILKINSRETENLTTIDETGNLKIFDKAEEIVEYFVKFRLGFYQKRKDYIIAKIQNEIQILNNKARFIKEIIQGNLKINNVPKQKIVDYLTAGKFDMVNDSYQYLLGMPIHSLTKEKYQELLNQVTDKNQELTDIQSKLPQDMYVEDLKNLRKAVN